MAIVVGLDVHRAQITYDALNTATGEVATGRITPADRATLRTFLRRWAGEEVEAAVEATTGWRFVVEELQRAGVQVQLAEPADTTAARGPKRRAKTDRRDARHLRDLLIERRLPQAWIAPEHILELRALVRLRKTLVDQRTEWLQRIHAVLFHHGVRLTVSGSTVATPASSWPPWSSRRPRNARSRWRWPSSSTSTVSWLRSTVTSRRSREPSPAAAR
jgi:transposase